MALPKAVIYAIDASARRPRPRRAQRRAPLACRTRPFLPRRPARPPAGACPTSSSPTCLMSRPATGRRCAGDPRPRAALGARRGPAGHARPSRGCCAKRRPACDRADVLLAEIAWDEGDRLRQIAGECFPGARVEVKKDLAGLDRLLLVAVSASRNQAEAKLLPSVLIAGAITISACWNSRIVLAPQTPSAVRRTPRQVLRAVAPRGRARG